MPEFRFSEQNFRRFELTIAKIVAAYPNSMIELAPAEFNSSVRSTCDLLRDAIKACRKVMWKSSYFDTTKLAFMEDISVAVRDEKVVAGPKMLVAATSARHNQIKASVAPSTGQQGQFVLDVNGPFTSEQLDRFGYLLAWRKLPACRLIGVNEKMLREAFDGYDTAIRMESENTAIVV